MAAVQGNKNAVAVQWLCSGSGKQQRRRISITAVKRLAGHEASTPALRRLRPPCKFPIPSSKFIQKNKY
ncbi:hypothetical protein ACFX1T_013277 [Malus domestica]